MSNSRRQHDRWSIVLACRSNGALLRGLLAQTAGRASRRFAQWWALLHKGKQPLGRRGEDAAAAYLRRRGYKIVARGEHVRGGELDLVAVDGRTIVFVEVKTRTSLDAGHPADAVGNEKQRRLSRLALAWLKRHGLLGYSARFDVVAVTWPVAQRRPTIEHFPAAFEATGPSGMFG